MHTDLMGASGFEPETQQAHVLFLIIGKQQAVRDGIVALCIVDATLDDRVFLPPDRRIDGEVQAEDRIRRIEQCRDIHEGVREVVIQILQADIRIGGICRTAQIESGGNH